MTRQQRTTGYEKRTKLSATLRPSTMQHRGKPTHLQQELKQHLQEIWQNDPRRCLFSPCCQGKPIKSHTVPKNILRAIQVANHVTRLTGRLLTDASGAISQPVKAEPIGIKKASIGPFVCRYHEDLFKEIERPDANLRDKRILDLMMYRATLLELWKQLTVTEPIAKYVPPSMPPHLRPSHRLRAITDLTNRLGQGFSPEVAGYQPAIEIKHVVRTIKTRTPIVAAAEAHSSADLVINQTTGQTIPMEQTQLHTHKEPNCSWSFTVIPGTDSHAVIVSYVANSEAERFFQHIATANGAELEAAVSAEIILFSENWYLNPSVWEAYGQKRQQAILTAYDNLDELITGAYDYDLKPPTQPWYDFLRVPNRRQINLFRF